MKKLLIIVLLFVGCATKTNYIDPSNLGRVSTEFFGKGITDISKIDDFVITSYDSTGTRTKPSRYIQSGIYGYAFYYNWKTDLPTKKRTPKEVIQPICNLFYTLLSMFGSLSELVLYLY